MVLLLITLRRVKSQEVRRHGGLVGNVLALMELSSTKLFLLNISRRLPRQKDDEKQEHIVTSRLEKDCL